MIKLVLFIYETLQFSNDSSTRCSLFACIRTFRVHACIFISGLYRGNRIWPFHGIVGFLMLVFSFSLCGFVLNNGRLDVDDVCVCVMFRLMFGLYTNGSRGRLRLPLLMCSISFLHLSLSLLSNGGKLFAPCLLSKKYLLALFALSSGFLKASLLGHFGCTFVSSVGTVVRIRRAIMSWLGVAFVS